MIQSVACARRILCRTEDGKLATSLEFEAAAGGSHYCVWDLEAAHSQTYILTALHSPRTIGPFPFATKNLKQSDRWILEQTTMDDDDGGGGGEVGSLVRLYLKSKGKYLNSNMEGSVSLTAALDGTELLWKMEPHPGGGYTFRSKSHGDMLAFTGEDTNAEPSLCTVSESTTTKREVWRVDPILPRAISSAKIKTFAIGTSVAVGTTVAMSFLMTGILAVVPAKATLFASILSVGLTGAEAIASVGAIGATAAIVFREASDSLGIESEGGGGEGGDETRADFTKRPLCGWMSW